MFRRIARNMHGSACRRLSFNLTQRRRGAERVDKLYLCFRVFRAS